MTLGFWLQMALYIFCMLLGAFGLRFALAERIRLSRLFYRVLLAVSILFFCLGFVMVLLVGRTYPEYYGSPSWGVSEDYKAVSASFPIHRYPNRGQ